MSQKALSDAELARELRDFKVGDTFIYTSSARWRNGKSDSFTETTTALIRITAVFDTRFEYAVEAIQNIKNPKPGLIISKPGERTGGMTKDYAVELLTRNDEEKKHFGGAWALEVV